MRTLKGVKFYSRRLRRALCGLLAVVSLMSALPLSALAEEASPYAGRLRICEIMAKNHATLTDELGGMPDYVEIENTSDKAIELGGFGIADGADKSPWLFPDISLAPGAQLLLYADNEDIRSEYLHTDFAISEGETLYLYDSEGAVIDTALCSCATADIALVRDEEGNWRESFYPSPGFPNSGAGYEAWQETLCCSSPLQISEAMVYNDRHIRQNNLGYCDWLEIKNVSDEPVMLSDYYLSDDDDYLKLWRFPDKLLYSGQSIIVLCDDSYKAPNEGHLKAPFKLGSERERVYLSDSEGKLRDYVFLRDIPYDCSYGRVDGQNGFFFFDRPSPDSPNYGGYRRVSAPPVSLYSDGVFENSRVKVAFEGKGDIFCSVDGSVPDITGYRYEGPFTVSETTIVRAICVEEGAMPSRPITLSYIMDQGHSLPVLSLVTNDASGFRYMYDNKRKDMEIPGSLSLYDGDSSFTIPCGIEMHGEASLSMRKKNMSVRMRGTYGQDMLYQDVFGGGVTEFSDFMLRSGQDFNETIVKNEWLQNLALQATDAVPTQRSKHCVLYIDGEYSGLYVLMEKLNEQFYASHYGVSKDSVTVIKARASSSSSFYQQVIVFAQQNDLRTEEAYRRFCEIVDIDSLIDWMIIEGYSSNEDITNGNLRYCRSDEGDGKWRFMLYDLDSTMLTAVYAFRNVLQPHSTQCAEFITPLMKNPDFKDRFLTRAAELLSTTFSNENALAELDRLTELIAPEVARDVGRFGRTEAQWRGSVETLRQRILEKNWSRFCMNNISTLFMLTEDEREHYFGF